MNRRRLSVALIAAASTTLALVSPVHAQTTTDTEQSQSSFMGPGELANSISSGNGSSGVPESEQEPAPAPEPEPELPGWAGSLEISPQAELALAIVGAVFAVGSFATKVAVFAIPIIPGAQEQLEQTLRGIGLV
ncbi:hypothetical protein [Corynebacterium suedekumii]|uniref:Secreted protein n=1 Tax=Corynebacterium suedekumii TaxID=3049801 RepID=A0ABY8VKB5_9CORY|nr:hypothetical protein [Corynebacterium suedekumii]WIM70080.1 hypothetical protein QP029_12970 [Corynebacterium suedekumii]